MKRNKNTIVWLFFIVLSVVLQGTFNFLDSKNTATKTAIEFSKAYFLLEEGMSKYLCQDFFKNNDNENRVKNYLETSHKKALNSGLDIKMNKRYLKHIKTKIVNKNDKSVKIRIIGSSKTSINPIFSWIGRLFNLGKTYNIDETIELVLENKEWKVCGFPFNL